MRYGLPCAASLVLAVGLAVGAGFHPTTANAQVAYAFASPPTTPAPSASAPKHASAAAGTAVAGQHNAAKRYFVEFRARNAASYGHFYVMYGEVNERHEIIKSEIAGFFPAGDARNCENCSVYNWTIGHVLPVPSEIGASDGDLEEQYVLARFRVWIDQAQYRRLVAYINERKAHRGPWNAFFANCVTFGRDVAVFLDLNVPLVLRTPSIVIYPETLIHMLAEANGVKKEQAPLRDAAGTLPVSTDVAAKPHSNDTHDANQDGDHQAPATTSHAKKQVSTQLDANAEH